MAYQKLKFVATFRFFKSLEEEKGSLQNLTWTAQINVALCV